MSQAVIAVEGARKRFGETIALDDVSLEIAEGEFFALLGPSGCGKTTLLRAIGGFASLDAGRILLDGADLGRARPYERPVNMMFQSYALFPHMRVRDNVAYGLRAERLPRDEIAARVDDVLGVVGLRDLADRRPAELSGGQRQRVALARSIVKRPRVLLLDEPLAALDRKLRQEMQSELKRLQHEVGLTFVVVTHDQEEAMTMADRIAVMRSGRVLQVAAPRDLYRHPADRFVASFIGTMNIVEGVATADGIRVDPLGEARLQTAGIAAGAALAVGIRPDDVLLLDAGAPAPPDAAFAFPAQVETTVFAGAQIHTVVRDARGRAFTATAGAGGEQRREGSDCVVVLPAAGLVVLPEGPA